MESRIIETNLPGVVIIETDFFRDERGLFIESYHRERFAAHGIPAEFVQDNHSRSAQGVLRGLHYQDDRQPQGKLLRCIRGVVWDVAVDIRLGSPTFGQWAGVELSEDNMRQFWVPEGFAHGFTALSASADLFYKCTSYYNPAVEGAIAWNDPDLAIAWPVTNPTLSGRDQQAMSLAEYRADPAFRYP